MPLKQMHSGLRLRAFLMLPSLFYQFGIHLAQPMKQCE